MVQIGDTEWDDELLADRVDVYRRPRRQDASGVDRLDPTTPAAGPDLTDVPCSIQYYGAQLVTGGVQAGVDADGIISFAEDLGLKPNDTLKSVSPGGSVQTLRVGLVRWEHTVDFGVYTAKFKQVT
jgi:hypothetical protein